MEADEDDYAVLGVSLEADVATMKKAFKFASVHRLLH